MKLSDYDFFNCRISKENIGEHDYDNRFLIDNIDDQLETWKEQHEGCTPIGICYELPSRYHGYYPMVYEDENGNRYWTHWNVDITKEYLDEGNL